MKRRTVEQDAIADASDIAVLVAFGEVEHLDVRRECRRVRRSVRTRFGGRRATTITRCPDSDPDACADSEQQHATNRPTLPTQAPCLADQNVGVYRWLIRRLHTSVQSQHGCSLRDGLDHGNDLIGLIALLTREDHELFHTRHDDTAFRRTRDGDASTSSKFEHSLVAQLT